MVTKVLKFYVMYVMLVCEDNQTTAYMKHVDTS